MQKSESQNPRFLSVVQTAHLLGVSRSSVDRMVMRGDMPSVRIGDMRRIEVADLEAWIAAQKAASLVRPEAETKNPVTEPAEVPPSRRRGRPQKAKLRSSTAG